MEIRDIHGNIVARKVGNRILDKYGNWVYEIVGDRINKRLSGYCGTILNYRHRAMGNQAKEALKTTNTQYGSLKRD